LVQLHNLAALLDTTGRDAEAEVVYRTVLERSKSGPGVERPEIIVEKWDVNILSGMEGLASAVGDQGSHRHAEADALYRQIVAAQDTMLGAEHAQTLITVSNHAHLLKRMVGRRADAVTQYERVLAVRKRTLGNAHPLTRSIVERLAELGVPPKKAQRGASTGRY
jgi:hypothetical protein